MISFRVLLAVVGLAIVSGLIVKGAETADRRDRVAIAERAR